jgi:hypothetical protein
MIKTMLPIIKAITNMIGIIKIGGPSGGGTFSSTSSFTSSTENRRISLVALLYSSLPGREALTL